MKKRSSSAPERGSSIRFESLTGVSGRDSIGDRSVPSGESSREITSTGKSTTKLTKKKRLKESGDIAPPTVKPSVYGRGPGGTQISASNGSKNVNAVTPETRFADSLTPFPNIDQVGSATTSLIDDSARQLHELMSSANRAAQNEENLFKTSQHINAACNCAKQIASLLRVKLDIYKSYKRKD